jgi:hypothetical protein
MIAEEEEEEEEEEFDNLLHRRHLQRLGGRR